MNASQLPDMNAAFTEGAYPEVAWMETLEVQ
jgi:hypothetical protein